MFELKISGESEARRLSKEWATHTISLRSPRSGRDNKKTGQSRCFYFDDVTPIQASIDSDLKAATSEQIQEILKFTAPLKYGDKLLVHCTVGVSRSPAVAIGILCQHGLTPNEAVKQVCSICPSAVPNEHIIKLFDDLFGFDGKLVAAASWEEISKILYESRRSHKK
jgi:predicted protein tyrosine phosphatase